MKIIRRRSVIPVYVAAAVWLAASLFLPMYRLWHYLIYGLAAAAAYVVAQHFFPGTVEEVEVPQAPPDSGDAEVDQLILEGRAQLSELRHLGETVDNGDISDRVETLAALSGKIFAALETDTTRLGRTRKFLNYYLPTTVKLLTRYRALEQQNAAGENITATMQSIAQMLEKIQLAFQKQLDNLYEAEAMDITADIQVMQSIMAAEGLLENE